MIGLIILTFFLFLIWRKGVSKAFVIFFIYSLLDKGLSFGGPLQVKDVILVAFLLLLFNRKRLVSKYKYPFVLCSLLSVVSYIATAYVSTEPHWPFTIMKCIRYFGFPICFYYYVIKSKNVFPSFVRGLLYFSLFIFLYSIVETIIGTSPIVNFVNDYNGSGYNMDEAFRYGVKRIQAVFIHSTALGYYCALVISFFMLFVSKRFRILYGISESLYFLVIAGLIVTAFLTGTRSAIIPIAIVLAWKYKSEIFKVKNLLGYTAIFCIVVFLASTYLADYLNSILESVLNTNDNAVGSSTDMRFTQFEIAFYYWAQAPLLGNGAGYTFEVVTPQNIEMYGAESIWMPLLIDNGIIGCIAYLMCYVSALKYILSNKFNINSIVFLGLIFLINTATSVPGFDISFILILVMSIVAILQEQNLKLQRV